jgi:hypothetical protein
MILHTSSRRLHRNEGTTGLHQRVDGMDTICGDVSISALCVKNGGSPLCTLSSLLVQLVRPAPPAKQRACTEKDWVGGDRLARGWDTEHDPNVHGDGCGEAHACSSTGSKRSYMSALR